MVDMEPLARLSIYAAAIMLGCSTLFIAMVTIGGLRRWWRGDPDPPGLDDLFG